jgi:probable rRNA maturation factor
MILLENLTDLLISVDLLEKIAIYLTDKDIELILGDDDFIQAMNHKFRRKNDPTDVLSFPIRGDRENEPIGSIIISMDQVIEKAEAYGHLPQDELALLFIHGLLHLMGFDHERDNGEMREKEEKLIWRFGLPTSLIIRAEEA